MKGGKKKQAPNLPGFSWLLGGLPTELSRRSKLTALWCSDVHVFGATLEKLSWSTTWHFGSRVTWVRVLVHGPHSRAAATASDYL